MHQIMTFDFLIYKLPFRFTHSSILNYFGCLFFLEFLKQINNKHFLVNSFYITSLLNLFFVSLRNSYRIQSKILYKNSKCYSKYFIFGQLPSIVHKTIEKQFIEINKLLW